MKRMLSHATRGVWISVSTLYFALPTSADAGRWVGESSCVPGHGIVQYWLARTIDEPRATVKGTIKKIEKNDSDICNDHDWNIFLEPNSEYSRYLKNSEGDVNRKAVLSSSSPGYEFVPSNLIELEIRTHPAANALKDHFPAGTLVEAYGWWVEDWGHAGKTELHPLTYMRSLGEAEFSIFVGKDGSGRFIDLVKNYGSANFWLDLASPSYSVGLDSNVSTATRPGSTSVISETARIDYLFLSPWLGSAISTPPSDSQLIGSRSTYYPSHFPATIALGVDLAPLGTHAQNHALFPYYLARFKKSTEDRFADSITLILGAHSGPIPEKYLRAQVAGKLASSTSSRIGYSTWRFEASDVAGNREWRTKEVLSANPTIHRVDYELQYNPTRNHPYRLEVIGSDRLPTWNAGARPNSVTGEQPAKTRTFLSTSREYVFTPSTVEIAVAQPSPCKTALSGRPECYCGYYLNLNYNFIHPNVTLKGEKHKWYVTFTHNSDGTPISNPTAKPLTPNSTVGIGTAAAGTTAAVTMDHNNAVRVDFAPMGGNAFHYPLSNFARSIIVIQDESELKEMMTDELTATQPSCRFDIGGVRFDTSITWRIFALIERLERLGISINPSNPQFLSPSELRAIKREWPSTVRGVEPPYAIRDELSSGNRKVLDAVARVSMGEKPASQEDLRIFEVLVDVIRKLPDIKRDKVPSDPLTREELKPLKKPSSR